MKLSSLSFPDWRWERAKLLAANPGRESPWADDEETLAAVEVIRNREVTAPLCSANPNITTALAFFEEDGQTRWKLETTILTGLLPEQVAEKLGLDYKVVAGPGASDAHTDGTLAAPSGPPASAEYPFLAPPQKPDELGRLGQYRVLSVFGIGGMGVVFRAEDPVLR